jgi:hypothetical protein
MSFTKHDENENEMNWDVTICVGRNLFLYLFPIKLFGRDINGFFSNCLMLHHWLASQEGFSIKMVTSF